jgi:flavin reductase (NADH)
VSRQIGGAARSGTRRGETPDDRAAAAPAENDVAAAFRAALARWASGVTVVAVRDEGRVFGITATAFTSVSVDPPLVLVCLGTNAVVLPMLDHGAPLVINLLAAAQKRTATIFTDVGPLGQELFAAEGPPLLPDALASLVCSVHAMHPAGDHTIVVARVQDVVMGSAAPPLLRYERAWRTLDGE